MPYECLVLSRDQSRMEVAAEVRCVSSSIKGDRGVARGMCDGPPPRAFHFVCVCFLTFNRSSRLFLAGVCRTDVEERVCEIGAA